MEGSVPTEGDWGDWSVDLDQRHTHEVYCGKSNEQMQERFVAAPVAVAGELQFMPTVPFRYYMLGFRDSVLSGSHDEVEAANAASCFVRLVQHKIQTDREAVLPLMPSLMPALEFIAEHQEEFGADEEIFGNLSELVGEIKSALSKQP